MNEFQKVVQRAKEDIAKKYVYVFMPIPQIQILLDGLEELENRVKELESA